MNSFIGKYFLLVVCFITVSSANLAEQDEFVYVLNSQNFDQFLVDNEFTVGKYKLKLKCSNFIKPYYSKCFTMLLGADIVLI